MHIIPIDALGGLHNALTASDAEREAIFDRDVMQPTRTFWERFARMRPQARPLDQLSPSEIARGVGFAGPHVDVSRTLAALAALARADAFAGCVRALEDAARRLDPAAHDIAFDELRFALVLGDPAHLDERLDMYTGVGMIPGHVLVTVWPTAFNVPRLGAIAVHELNHNVRFRFEPWSPQTTVGKYLVDEGVAECFAAEIFGETVLGRWTTGHDDATIEALRPRYRDAIDVTGFDEIRGWIFGDWSAEEFHHTKHGVPDFAGYAMGYRIVRAYLERTGLTAAEATYRPWHEIVEASRFL